MAGSRRHGRRSQGQRAPAAARRNLPQNHSTPNSDGICVGVVDRLPPELLAEIRRRLPFLHRLAFASICGALGSLLHPEATWLVLPGETEEKATLLSFADGGQPAVARTSDPAMRGHVVLGSSGGWLVTADERGALRMANPATDAQGDLPAIATIPLFLSWDHWFCLDSDAFAQFRFAGAPPPEDRTWGIPPRTYTLRADQLRHWFYRKVVLSVTSRPSSYTAMLIPERTFGVPAFATADDPNWKVAPSRDGIEDGIHHGGRFYSITYSGVVEAWDHDVETGEFTSTVLSPNLIVEGNSKKSRKYLAAAPDGRLMAVVKDFKEVEELSGYGYPTMVERLRFKVKVLGEANGGQWEKVGDISDNAMFVGVNGSLCVSTREHPRIKAGCVYFTDDEIGAAALRQEGSRPSRYGEDRDELRHLGVYSLRKSTVERIDNLREHPCWPPAAWLTPAFL